MEIKHKACPCPNCIAVLSLLVNLWVDCPQFLSLSKKKHLLVLYTERERVTHSHRWMNQRCSRIWQGGRGEERGQRCSSPSHDKPPFPIQILHRSSPYSNGQKRLGDLYSTHRPCQKKKNCMVPWTKFTVDYGHVHRHITTMGPWPARCGLRPMVSSCSCVDLFLALQQQTWRIFISPNDLFF